MDEELVPVDRVIDDMYNPNGGPVSWAARSYYYQHYATPEEQIMMDREDKIDNIIAAVFSLGYFTLLIYTIVSSLF